MRPSEEMAGYIGRVRKEGELLPLTAGHGISSSPAKERQYPRHCQQSEKDPARCIIGLPVRLSRWRRNRRRRPGVAGINHVFGPVDDAHPAAAELFNDSIPGSRPADHA